MDSQSLQVELPEGLRRYIDERIQQGDYADASEYVRDLVRRDREARAAIRLKELIEQGLASGPARPMAEADWVALQARAVPSDA